MDFEPFKYGWVDIKRLIKLLNDFFILLILSMSKYMKLNESSEVVEKIVASNLEQHDSISE